MAQALLYMKEIFVSVDKTGCDRHNSMRKYGYAIRGEYLGSWSGGRGFQLWLQ